MIRTVVVPVADNLSPFELGVLCEVFGLDRPDEPLLPTFDFRLATERPGPVTTASGFTIQVEHGLDAMAAADLVAVPALDLPGPAPAAMLDQVRAAVDRGAWVMSVCTGAFVLGAAGVLDGRRCTTHWKHADRLQQLVPTAEVDPDVLYVEDGNVLTSAGTAAGIDASLHLLRKEFGPRAANVLARRMVMPPHRDGGQRQFIDQPVPCEADTLAGTLQWMQENLAQDVTVDQLAARAHLSPRTFARRFRAETGTTPHHWLTDQRILHAQRLLEETSQPVETVADLVGFGSASVLRHHFARRLGTTPQAYRRTFARSAAS